MVLIYTTEDNKKRKKLAKNHDTLSLSYDNFYEETVLLLLCSFDLASLACMSLSKIGGSNGITSRHLSEAATITC